MDYIEEMIMFISITNSLNTNGFLNMKALVVKSEIMKEEGEWGEATTFIA